MLAGLTNNPYYYNPRRNFYTRTSDTTDYKALTNNRHRLCAALHV